MGGGAHGDYPRYSSQTRLIADFKKQSDSQRLKKVGASPANILNRIAQLYSNFIAV